MSVSPLMAGEFADSFGTADSDLLVVVFVHLVNTRGETSHIVFRRDLIQLLDLCALLVPNRADFVFVVVFDFLHVFGEFLLELLIGLVALAGDDVALDVDFELELGGLKALRREESGLPCKSVPCAWRREE